MTSRVRAETAGSSSRPVYELANVSKYFGEQFFTGLKIAAISVVSGAIAGEFLGGGQGFGELIRVAASQLDTPRVFSLIIYLSALGLVMFGTVSWLQYKFVFWHRTSNNVATKASL